MLPLRGESAKRQCKACGHEGYCPFGQNGIRHSRMPGDASAMRF
jgi:hypothetical protein